MVHCEKTWNRPAFIQLVSRAGSVWAFPSLDRAGAALRPKRAERSSAWVRSPAWDGVWMLNALWLAPIALWLARGYDDPESSPLDLLYFGLSALFWIGHRLSSTYLAYCTEAYRPLLRAQPIRFVVLP